MSDLYQIKSEHLQVEISSLGAQVMSIKDKEGLEYLWQGDPQFWAELFWFFLNILTLCKKAAKIKK